ncbi:MAG: N-acetylmuramoyl-L-alanine amidase [Flavobacteriales bacterium]
MRWVLAACAGALLCAHAMPQAADPNKVKVVVLDAGHGGKDPGNLGTGRYKTTEKHVALAITKLVGKYINENFPDVKVIYTRDNDTFVELKERCEIANRNKADVFISIHCNANQNADPNGSETYVMGLHKTEANMRTAMKENASILLEDDHALKYDGYDPKDPESMIALSLRQNAYLDHSLQLSAAVQRQFKDRVGRPDRGVKQAGFLVISYTTMPAVLIELGFLSNSTEEDFLQSEKGQDLMASAIYRAFKEYKGQIEGKDVSIGGAPAKPDTPRVDTSRADNAAKPKPTPPPAAKAGGVSFKVQIVTSTKRIELKPKNFKGLEGVEEVKGADVWKYMVGDEQDLDGARKLQKACKEKGYDGAFIVAFKDGERIDLQQAVILSRDRQAH